MNYNIYANGMESRFIPKKKELNVTAVVMTSLMLAVVAYGLLAKFY